MTEEFLREIPGYHFFKNFQLLDQPSLAEKRYSIERKTGSSLLLTLSSHEEYERKRSEYSFLEKLYSHGIPMPRPEGFGTCGNGKYLYQLTEQVEGVPSSQVISSLTATHQYQVGYNSGQILSKIHALTPPTSFSWNEYFEQIVSGIFSCYKSCGYRLDQEDLFFSTIENNLILLDKRPVRILHGDYQPDHLLITPHKTVAVTGFCYQLGDPFCDFCSLPLFYNLSISFATGLIDGYFAGNAIPSHFFEIISFYLAVDTLSAFSWACEQNIEKIEMVKENASLLCDWFENFTNPVPIWYQKRNSYQ